MGDGLAQADVGERLAGAGVQHEEEAPQARGEVDLGAGSIFYGLYSAIQKGEPIKFFIPKEGVPFGLAPSAILKKAPHPHAAKVFTDYLFSLEAQQILADNYLHVGHPDVKYPKGVPNLDKIKLLTVPGEELMKKSKETRKKFRAIFGV
ncbi:ABC transporter substrate-binding protein [Nitrospinota bacterium]